MKTTIKFTGPNRKAIYGKSDYPPVGEWSEVRIPQLCESGWHVSADDKLANVLGWEMWVVEVDGKNASDKTKGAWERIRFVRKVDEWNCVEFAKWCAANAANAANAAAANAATYAASAASAASEAARAAANAANAARSAADAAAYAAANAASYAYAAANAYAACKAQSDELRRIAGI